jgi:hypothetical protein
MKNFLVSTLLILSSIFSHAQYKGESWESVKATGSGVLTVVYYEQPGLIQNVDGTMKGVCVDILEDFVQFVKTKYNKNLKVNYAGNENQFANFLKVVQNTPNLLGVTNTSITSERKRIFKFTPAFMTTPLVLLTHQSAPSLKSLDQLSVTFKGFSADVIAGTTHASLMEKIKQDYYPELKIDMVGSNEVLLKNLSSNPKLFSIIDFTEYVSVVRKHLPIKRQEVNLGDGEELAFVMSKQSDWDVLWKEFLTPEYKKSVGYKKIVSENLGATFLNLVR